MAALRGWALVQNGSPGAARRAVDGHTGRGSAVHDLVALYAALELSDRDAAEHALAAIRRVPGPVADRMRPHLLSGWLRLGLLRDEGPYLTDHIAELVPRKITRRPLIPAGERTVGGGRAKRCMMAIAPPAGLLASLSARSRRTEAPRRPSRASTPVPTSGSRTRKANCWERGSCWTMCPAK